MWKPPILGIDLVFDIGAAILGVVKAPHGKSRDVGCSRRLLCVWMHSCARADCQNTQELFHLWVPAFQLWGRRGKCCLFPASFPTERHQAASRLAASCEGIMTIKADSIHFPQPWLLQGGLWVTQEYLPSFLQECHFSWQRIAPEQAQPQWSQKKMSICLQFLQFVFQDRWN